MLGLLSRGGKITRLLVGNLVASPVTIALPVQRTGSASSKLVKLFVKVPLMRFFRLDKITRAQRKFHAEKGSSH